MSNLTTYIVHVSCPRHSDYNLPCIIILYVSVTPQCGKLSTQTPHNVEFINMNTSYVLCGNSSTTFGYATYEFSRSFTPTSHAQHPTDGATHKGDTYLSAGTLRHQTNEHTYIPTYHSWLILSMTSVLNHLPRNTNPLTSTIMCTTII